jgi:hypothetical protein
MLPIDGCYHNEKRYKEEDNEANPRQSSGDHGDASFCLWGITEHKIEAVQSILAVYSIRLHISIKKA